MPSNRYTDKTVCFLALAVLVMLTLRAGAQAACDGPITVSPLNPTTQTPITISFLGLDETCSTLTHEISGNTITIFNEWDCFITAVYEQRHVVIPNLPPGTYDVRVLRSRNDPPEPALACGSFTVSAAAASIPTLSPSILSALAVIMSLLGYFATRRTL